MQTVHFLIEFIFGNIYRLSKLIASRLHQNITRELCFDLDLRSVESHTLLHRAVYCISLKGFSIPPTHNFVPFSNHVHLSVCFNTGTLVCDEPTHPQAHVMKTAKEKFK